MKLDITGNPGTGNTFSETHIDYVENYNPNAQTVINNNYGNYTIVENVSDMHYPKSILTYQKPHPSVALHPTQKPVELIEWLIKTYTNEGDLILDNCMGSGTTGVACKNLNRNFFGIEKDKKYFDIAKERIYATQEK